MVMWSGRLARFAGSVDDPEVDLPNIGTTTAKGIPSSQRIPHPSQFQSPGKVISAASRHNQHGQPEFHEMAKVTMYCPIAAKEQNGIDLTPLRRHAKLPLHGFVSLKGL